MDNFVTVVEASHPIGKSFHITGSNGTARVETDNRAFTQGHCMTLVCNNLADLEKILRSLTPSQALILGWMKGSVPGVPYYLMPEAQLKAHLGVDERPLGLHMTQSGMQIGGRFKQNFANGRIFLLDRDTDPQMLSSCGG